jgi:hypothetical protein
VDAVGSGNQSSRSASKMHFCPPCGNLLLLEVNASCSIRSRCCQTGAECFWCLFAQTVNGGLRFYCQTCPYVYQLKAMVCLTAPIVVKVRHHVGRRMALLLHRVQVSSEVPLDHKQVDDVLGGAQAWKNADQTDGEPLCRVRPTSFCAHSLALPFSTRSQLSKVYQQESILSAAANSLSR